MDFDQINMTNLKLDPVLISQMSLVLTISKQVDIGKMNLGLTVSEQMNLHQMASNKTIHEYRLLGKAPEAGSFVPQPVTSLSGIAISLKAGNFMKPLQV